MRLVIVFINIHDRVSSMLELSATISLIFKTKLEEKAAELNIKLNQLEKKN